MARETDLQRFSRLVLDEIKDFREDVDQRFDQVGTRFDAVDARLSHITAELTQIVRRLDELEEQIADLKGFAKEIDDNPRAGERHRAPPRHQQEDRCLILLVPALFFVVLPAAAQSVAPHAIVPRCREPHCVAALRASIAGATNTARASGVPLR